MILRKIVDEVGFGIPIQELFDLAIGTSTGMSPKTHLEDIPNGFRWYCSTRLVQNGLVSG